MRRRIERIGGINGMKLVIFDCDGTLVDSQNAIFASMAHAFESHGLEQPSRHRVLSIVGLSLPQAIQVLLPDHKMPFVHAVSASYKGAFQKLRTEPSHREPLFSGAGVTLKRLAARDDVVLGIATGKSQRGVDLLLEREGWQSYFATIQTADNAPSKPDPGMILQAMAEVGADPAATVMIGDTTYDIEMARAAGVTALGVAWGYHPVADLKRAGAHRIVVDFAELHAAIEAGIGNSGGVT